MHPGGLCPPPGIDPDLEFLRSEVNPPRHFSSNRTLSIGFLSAWVHPPVLSQKMSQIL